MKCPFCGEYVTNGDLICPHCGADLNHSMNSIKNKTRHMTN